MKTIKNIAIIVILAITAFYDDYSHAMFSRTAQQTKRGAQSALTSATRGGLDTQSTLYRPALAPSTRPFSTVGLRSNFTQQKNLTQLQSAATLSAAKSLNARSFSTTYQRAVYEMMSKEKNKIIDDLQNINNQLSWQKTRPSKLALGKDTEYLMNMVITPSNKYFQQATTSLLQQEANFNAKAAASGFLKRLWATGNLTSTINSKSNEIKNKMLYSDLPRYFYAIYIHTPGSYLSFDDFSAKIIDYINNHISQDYEMSIGHDNFAQQAFFNTLFNQGPQTLYGKKQKESYTGQQYSDTSQTRTETKSSQPNQPINFSDIPTPTKETPVTIDNITPLVQEFITAINTITTPLQTNAGETDYVLNQEYQNDQSILNRIKERYRKLFMLIHPDKHPANQSSATTLAQALNAANARFKAATNK